MPSGKPVYDNPRVNGGVLDAVIQVNNNGDNELVAAVTDKKIKVVYFYLVAATAVTVRFEAGAGGEALTGQMSFGDNGGMVSANNARRVMKLPSTAGANLNLELNGAVTVSGYLQYVLVD